MLALYSTVSVLAYTINEKFYRGAHWVWAAPAPDRQGYGSYNPDSSHPWLLYKRYLRDSSHNGGDKHSDLIQRNRTGIIRGAQSREVQGLISAADRGSIEQIAQKAELKDFYPVFMVMPYDGVKHLAKEVDVADRANPFSREYIMTDLPSSLFDIWNETL